MRKSTLHTKEGHTLATKKQQFENLARILEISYEGVLKLRPKIAVATDWDKNKDFLLVEICGNPPKYLVEKIRTHLVGNRYIHLQYGILDQTNSKAN